MQEARAVRLVALSRDTPLAGRPAVASFPIGCGIRRKKPTHFRERAFAMHLLEPVPQIDRTAASCGRAKVSLWWTDGFLLLIMRRLLRLLPGGRMMETDQLAGTCSRRSRTRPSCPGRGARLTTCWMDPRMPGSDSQYNHDALSLANGPPPQSGSARFPGPVGPAAAWLAKTRLTGSPTWLRPLFLALIPPDRA